MSQLRFFLFGSPRLKRRGEAVDLGLRKAMALLAYLVVTKGEYSRDDLATLLWPESDQSSARASLRRTLYVINRTLGEGVLTTGAETIRLDPKVRIWTDVGLFQQHMRACSPADEHQEEITPHCLSALEEAVALYKADLLAGFSLPDCVSFDEWLFFESEGLRQSLARALRQLAAAYQTQGEFERAIQHGRRWLALDPLHEPAHRLLMGLYAESRQQAAALRQYTECVRILDQELGLPPQPETTELYQNIRLYRKTATTPAPKARPPVEYVRSGDVHIAYQVLGEGPVDILHICGYLSPLEHFWELPDSSAFIGELASFSRLILFDRRGGGLSERVGYPPHPGRHRGRHPGSDAGRGFKAPRALWHHRSGSELRTVRCYTPGACVWADPVRDASEMDPLRGLSLGAYPGAVGCVVQKTHGELGPASQYRALCPQPRPGSSAPGMVGEGAAYCVQSWGHEGRSGGDAGYLSLIHI
jgi:DNA-binding SARP family transcriptional activator